ncbi:MAG TPA: response regulator [Burkholderiaceae bacterium]|nr:response regulator [Burkholderiaceae bacterium]
MRSAVRLMVVDDHPLFRRGLVALLTQDERFVVLHEAADAGEAVRCVTREQPDLILLDNHLPGVRGVDAIAGLKEVAPDVKILMLTVSENEQDLSAALKAGADGYLLKTINAEDLSDSILKVLDGDSVVSPEMTSKLVAAFRGSAAPQAVPGAFNAHARGATASPVDGLEVLSAREREILTLISRGASNKVIARDLDIAETTVKIHVQHILRKLNLSSRVQAAVYAAARGIG